MALETLITGPGRSGTTLLARAFYEAGFDLGNRPEAQPDWIPESAMRDGGLEDGRLADLNVRLMAAAAERKWKLDETGRALAGVIAETVDELPQVAKSPGAIWTLPMFRAAGHLPKRVLISTRTPAEIARSLRACYPLPDRTAERLAVLRVEQSWRLVWELRNSCDVRLVTFPEWAEDRAYFEERLGDLLPWEVVTKSYRAELVRFRA